MRHVLLGPGTYGAWYAGRVEDCRRTQDGWRALVRYAIAPGSTYLH